MIQPFVFLTLRTLKNRIVYRLRRLKELRYLAGAIVGLAYFAFLFTRGGHRPGGRGYERLTVDMGSIAVLVLMLLAWIIPAMSSLAFSEAELHFIIGGPVTRRRVLLYKLMSAQPQIVIGLLVATFLGIPNGRGLGLWVSYTVMTAYTTFVAIARHRMNERGIRTAWIATAAFLLLIGAIALIVHFSHKPGAGGTPWDAPALTPFLFLPRILARPLFARTPLDLAIAVLPVLAVGAMLFFLSSTIRVQFDELVQTASERVTRMRARLQAQPGSRVSFRNLSAPFRMPLRATPEIAIFWKNTTAVMRMALSGAVMMFVFAVAFLVGTIAWDEPNLKVMCASFALCLAGGFPLLGSMMFKQDYRLDVTRADVLKTWPITGERLIGAEIAAPLAAMSVVELILIANALVCSHLAMDKVAFFSSARVAVVAVLVAVPVCAIQLLLRNAVAVMFPGWGFRTREEQRGFAAMGQRILGMITNLVALGLLLGPAAAVSAAGWWIAHRLAGDSAAALAAATMPAVFLLVLETWLFVRILGAQYDKLDVGKDLEPVAV